SSAWVQLTNAFTALVNGTPTAAAYTVTIDTVKDSLGATYTLAADELIGYTCLNVSLATPLAAYITDSTSTVITFPNIAGSTGLVFADENKLVFFKTNWLFNNFHKSNVITNATNASPIVITAAGHGLVTGNSITIVSVGGNTAANATWTITKLTADTFSLDTSTGNGAYTSGGTLTKASWTGADINLDLGITTALPTPHNRWLPVEAQKKVNLALGTSANPPVMKNLQRIQLNAAKPLFYDGTSAYLLTLPARWDAETVGGLCTYFLAKGSAGTPITTVLTTGTSTDVDITVPNDTNASAVAGANFMQINYDVTHTATAGAIETHLRFAVTLEYDGYQESDPVYKGYFECPADYIPAVLINSIGINPATMPKNLTAINFYMASHDNSLTGVQWIDSDADYKLVYSMPINSTQYNSWGVLTDYTAALVRWVLAPTSQYCYSLTCGTTINISGSVQYFVGEIDPIVYELTVGTGYSVGDILTLHNTGEEDSGDATVKVEQINWRTVLGDVGAVSLVYGGTSGYKEGIYHTTVVPAGGTGCEIIVTRLSEKYGTSTNGTLAGRLARAVDINRSLITPRYMVKSARNQAAIQVVDKDEATLRLTCYDGAGTHEDDNLPDITADSNGNRQLIALNGKGIMQGLAISRDVITVFRSTEAETFDLQNGSQGIFDIDFLAKDSLVKSPYGLTWAGRTGIWWMPEDGRSIRQINLKWGNLYDGSMMTDNGTTPYLTDAQRTNIISGYDPYTKAVIFSYQVTKKDNSATEYMTAEYEFEKDRWSFKVLGGSAQAKYFSQTTRLADSTDAAKLIIGTTTALALYPNLTGSFPYTDFETAASAIGSGFDTNITVNIKDLYNQVQSGNLQCILIDHNSSSTDGVGNFQIDFYANDQVTAFDTQYMAIDKIGEFINIGEWGNIDSLRIKLSLVGTLSNIKKWDVSRIVLGFKKNIRTGNI
ncbi:MAG: hypothetical protein IMZ53_10020, partial [Thermoplasmata archaeon]|nr:hypothetical protein [Thermoplasmata archaeon]